MKTSEEQIRELLLREGRGDYEPEGVGKDFQWFIDNWQIVRGLRKGEITLVQFPCQIYCPELIPVSKTRNPWEVIKDVPPTIKSIADLDFVPFLEEGKPGISGKEMRRRAGILKARHGLSDVRFLLDHQEEIPEKVFGKVIVFAGTVLSNYHGGSLFVPCFRRIEGLWTLVWTLLNDPSFDSLCVLPRHKSNRAQLIDFWELDAMWFLNH